METQFDLLTLSCIPAAQKQIPPNQTRYAALEALLYGVSVPMLVSGAPWWGLFLLNSGSAPFFIFLKKSAEPSLYGSLATVSFVLSLCLRVFCLCNIGHKEISQGPDHTLLSVRSFLSGSG